MMERFSYPMRMHVLDEFRHPAEWHGLHHARRHGDEVLAGNGYVAIRVKRGMWLESDHAPASAEFLSRWGKLPWKRFEALENDWRATDSQSGKLFAKAEIGFWMDERPAPSPVWRVNEATLVRLSLLQLVARLPRCEIYTGRQNMNEGVFLRFSGGIGIIAADPRLTLASAEFFPPRRDLWTEARLDKQPVFQGVESHLKNWPPADETDTL